MPIVVCDNVIKIHKQGSLEVVALQGLDFTMELGEDFEDGKLPSLDINIWVVGGKLVLYEFFEKVMASNLMVEAGSALSK